MSAVFKGRQSATLVSEEPVYDAATGVREFDQTFAGSKLAIFAMAQQFEDDRVSYRVTNNGPVYVITARVPQIDPLLDNPDRYEIFTESASLPIFSLPEIQGDAEVYDNVGSAQDTYKTTAEQAARETMQVGDTRFTNPSAELDRFQSVVRHLRSDVTGYEEDNLALVRFRQIDNAYATGTGKFNLRESRLIYTTAQLALPSDIAFTLTDLPSGTDGLTQDYRWGWRLRGQRVERVGSLTEQTIHLTYAAWSTLAYFDAGGNLNW